MVRQLLGNIRGPRGERGLQGTQGPQGPKGDDGGFNGESIGIINKLDITKTTSIPNNSTIELVDEETGLYEYNFGEQGFFRIDITLNPTVHTFRVSDFTVTPEVYSGRFRFQVRHPNGDYLIATDVDGGQPLTFDLTDESQPLEYQIYFHRVVGSGFIKQPMLVEGDYSVNWNYPEKSGAEYISALLRGEITGLQAEPSFASISGATSGSTQSINSNNEIVLTKGVWVVSINAYLSPINYDEYVNIGIYHNNTQVSLLQKGSTLSKDFSGTQIVRVNEGDRVSVRAYKNSSGGTVSFGATSSNKINVYKIGV